ncbi:phage distal tail protein [Paenibacillus ehimensis]|uniref:phage distal tail protein n=1 Tax=Paenibacillus ehimensis TaxID=79264 RepID=UPI00046FF98B|nr:phage tail domain-containing protein [Paenibacillus ehimensis]
MFNRTPFNRTPFNRPFSVDIFGSIVMNGVGGLEATGNIEVYAQIGLSGVGTLEADAIRELFFSAALEGIGTLSADAIRERITAAIMNGVGTLTALGSRYHVDYVQFSGEFRPGDRIIIDSKKLKMTLNDANALHMMQGDFFDLNLGENHLTYTDSETGRSVLIRVTYRDKFV